MNLGSLSDLPQMVLATVAPVGDPRPMNLDGVVSKIKVLGGYFFAVGTVYFVVMIGKNALVLAKSGDNPQAMAQAKAALWMNALGGVIFFGATAVAGLFQWFGESLGNP